MKAITCMLLLFSAWSLRAAHEHKFPAAVNDSYNAFKWIAEHGSELAGDNNIKN